MLQKQFHFVKFQAVVLVSEVNVAGAPVGQGLNTALRASHSQHSELGLKWRPAAQTQLQTALFRIRTDDEIVTDISAGGKTAYRNATRTSRDGLELSGRSVLHSQWLLQASATVMTARYADAAGSIAAGNLMPALPKRQWVASARWAQAGYSASGRCTCRRHLPRRARARRRQRAVAP
jgi:iron complex outermembrane receptor protein